MVTSEQTQAIQRYSDVWASGDLDVLDEVFTADCVRHGPALEGTSVKGAQGLKEIVELYRTALPDLRVPIDTMVGDGDVVMTRWSASGTNNGPVLGTPPTGKSFTIFGFWMHRFEGDKIAEEWATWDTHGFLGQLGVSLP
ncbi:MAG TPA: ester cyclase [Pseudonocardia sp.]|jgi:steroid delta-isomerase-like uncharacterized protein|uniref:ester cyclase n=1 Tax=Pseudonocardia sp. TaxID=60912 RepID=UPI002BBBAF4D|nr:ester cyclase [Pseudonocardia sp.]HTF48429.1 ester cyclase [Pseudonocardia sp.]